MARSSPSFGRGKTVVQRLVSLPLITSLVLASGVGIGQMAIVPQPAHAYTATVDIELEPKVNETYETLLRRAEAIARAATQRSFDQDILVTEVALTILAQGEGATVPLMTMQVSRPQWRSRPDPQQWATYFRSAQTFLRFNQPATSTTTPAQPAPTPTPTPQATPTPQPTPTFIPQQPLQVPVPGSQPAQVPQYTPGGPPLPVPPTPQENAPTTPPTTNTEPANTEQPGQVETPDLPERRDD